MFYEKLYANREQELLRLFGYLYGDEGAFLEKKLLEKIRVPSRVSGKLTNIVSGRSPVSLWKDRLTALQIDKGVDILCSFGLEEIYGTECIPDPRVIDKLITREKAK